MPFWIPFSALGWVCGTAIQLQQPELWPMWIYIALCAASGCLSLALLWRRSRSGGYAFMLGAVLAFAITGWRASDRLAQALPEALEGPSLQLVGIVAAMPQRSGDSQRFTFDVESARTLGSEHQPSHEVTVPSRVLLSWHAPTHGPGEQANAIRQPELQVGDRWSWTVRLKAPHGERNPHGFDLELWMWEQGLHASGTVRQARQEPAPRRLGVTRLHRIEQWRQSARDAILSHIQDPSAAGVVAALVVGDQAAIDRSGWDLFRATGVAHLMAISGLHITGLAWLASSVMGWLWRHSDFWTLGKPLSLRWPTPSVASVSGWLVALAYALFAGWGVPSQRTVWMLGVVVLLRVSGRAWPWPRTWLVVCAVVLAWDPWAMLQPGFWLSFVAVGMLFAGGPSHAAQSSGKTSRIMAAVRRMWREQWQMSVGLAPLSLLLFQQVSVVGLAANLLAVPWVTLVITPLSMLGLAWPWLWGGAVWALQWLTAWLHYLSTWPWVQWSWPAVPLWVGVAAVLGMGLSVLPWPVSMRLIGLSWTLPFFFWQLPRPAAGEFELLAVDVGQGQAVLVQTRQHALLYDTGPGYVSGSNAGQRILVPLLRALDVRLDRVVISHEDLDHSGGARAVLAMQPQADVVSSMPPDHPLRQAHSMTSCLQGHHWAWDGVKFQILHPPDDAHAQMRKSNARSCVLRIEDAQGVVALLVGDIEAAQERELIQQRLPLKADWLSVPHHGSNTSSTAAFIGAVQPRVAMVQAGYRNRYGHPQADVLARYATQDVMVVQTVPCGAGAWRSAEPDRVVCEREKNARYWQHRALQVERDDD